MIISIASGKGGTGKTTIAVNLARVLGENVMLLDCDVEEPNSHIFLKPEFNEFKKVEIPIPEVDLEKCDRCGKCGEICRFNAILVLREKVLTFPDLCHGCGGCSLVCPTGAIREVGREVGIVEKGYAGEIEFIHGKLRIGEPIVPPLIRAVKRYINSEKNIIIDSPPGTSCSVIESIKGSHFCVLVTEPTPFGLNDLRLAVEVTRELKVPVGVVVNRCDTGHKEVYEYCESENIEILSEIPIDLNIARSYSRGDLIVDKFPEYKKIFLKFPHHELCSNHCLPRTRPW